MKAHVQCFGEVPSKMPGTMKRCLLNTDVDLINLGKLLARHNRVTGHQSFTVHIPLNQPLQTPQSDGEWLRAVRTPGNGSDAADAK